MAQTQKGLLRFPDDFRGSWCIFFCHPANFTNSWRMYSDYLKQKERWLQERNTRLLVLSNQTVCGDLWKDLVCRYLRLRLRAPIIEDTDNQIADLYGMSPSQQITPPNHRLLYIIDPEGIIRFFVCRPLLSIQQSLARIAAELERLQQSDAKLPEEPPASLLHTTANECLDDALSERPKRPAYLRPFKNHPN
ncbi:MAG: redoxin domain-containing protein [Saprospiraceae bacterium]|nr:redoxin domain-containing protein [Saprospiraceae bacterium]MDW8230097.1 redoxin domain-containing protein [Saprospiraceae bacterium]